MVLTVQRTEIALLALVDRLIVGKGFAIELRALGTVLRLQICGQRAHGIDIDIDGMERKDADGIVGIGIAVGMAPSGVVDGERLDKLHARLRRPIGQGTQVVELADTKAVLAAQRENGQHDPRAAKVGTRTAETAVVGDKKAGSGKGFDTAIVAILQIDYGARAAVVDHILVLEGRCGADSGLR